MYIFDCWKLRRKKNPDFCIRTFSFGPLAAGLFVLRTFRCRTFRGRTFCRSTLLSIDTYLSFTSKYLTCVRNGVSSVRRLGERMHLIFFYVPEAYIMHFIWRRWFPNYSEEEGCMDGEGGGGGGYVNLFMYLFFIWSLYLMILRRANLLLGASEELGPKKSWFPGPNPSKGHRNGYYPLQNHYLRSAPYNQQVH